MIRVPWDLFLSRGSDERSEERAASQNKARLQPQKKKKKKNGENLCEFKFHAMPLRMCREKSSGKFKLAPRNGSEMHAEFAGYFPDV